MRHRGRFIVLVLVVVLGLVLAGRMLYVGDKGETSTPTGGGGHADRKAQSAEQESGVSQAELQQHHRLRPQELEQGSAGTQRNAQPVDQNQQVHVGDTPITQSADQAQSRPPAENPSANADREQGSDFSVVGQPVPVSESILTACESTQNSVKLRHCRTMRKLRDAMTEEPREEPWASDTEQAIRTLVELEPGTGYPRAVTYTIRALECRRSICFLETASIIESFHTELSDFERNRDLRAEYSINSIEIDEPGNHVHVTLYPFCKKVSCVTPWH